MRILFQSLIEMGRTPAYFDGMKARVAQIARAGTCVDFVGMPAGIYGKHPPSDIVIYPYMAALHGQFILDNALRAQAEGYDVFAIGSVQDPMLEEARSLVDIPVVGYGESAMHFACCLSTKFVVLVFQKGFDQMMDLRIQRLGLASRALPTRVIDVGFDDIGRGLSGAGDLVEQFLECARGAIEDGAEAVIPGQLYLSEAIARAGVTRIDEAPIVEGLAATLKMAEAMGDLKSLGIGVTRRGYLHARPSDAALREARQFHGRPEIVGKKGSQ